MTASPQTVDPFTVFIARCEARALLVRAGELDLQSAVDGLQEAAVAYGLVNELGQGAVQEILSREFGGVRA